MRAFKKGLSLFFMLALILSLVSAIPFSADEPALSTDSYDVVFLSDLHNGLGGYTGLQHMMAELSAEGQNPRVLSHGGDYVEDDQGGEVNWQTEVYDVISGTEKAAFPDAAQVYTMGNHDWEDGTFGRRSDKEAAFEEVFGFPRCGLAYADDEMEIYMIGAQNKTGAGGGGEGFNDDDIDDFDDYLATKEGSGKVIFLQTHWPAHSGFNFKQRVVANAGKLIDVMNNYGDKMDLVWMWGHNHYEDPMRYTILQPGDEIMYSADANGSSWGNPRNPQYKPINFTYANVGCMNDMWWKHDGNNDTDVAGNYRGPSACVSVAVEKNSITFTYNRIKQDENGEWVFSHDANLQIHDVLKEHPANVTVDRLRIALDSIGVIKYESSCNITGQVRSPSELTSVTGEILKIIPDQADDAGITYESIQTYTEYPGRKLLELAGSKINANLDFSILDPGDYILEIRAENADGAAAKTVSFTVSPPPVPKITLTKFANNKIAYGSDPNISKTVASAEAKLTGVTGEILSGTTVVQTYTEYPDANTLNLTTSEINANLDFSILDPGAYTLTIAAENAGGAATSSFNFTVSPPSKPGITLKNFDKIKIPYGRDRGLTGTVNSAVAKLTGVTGEILSGTTVLQTHTDYPDGRTLSLAGSGIDDALDFSKLNPGSYKLRISAANIGGTTTKTFSFTVNKPPLPTVTVGSVGTVPYGNDRILTGTVTSTNADLTGVTAQILSGSTVKQTCTVSPDARTFDLAGSEINDILDLSALNPGSYTLRIKAANIGGTTTKTVSFTIKKPPLPSIALDSIGTVTYESDHIITGTVASTDADLTGVTVQILSGTKVKQKHTVSPNARTFDLAGSEINDILDFSKLSPGSYKLKISAVNIGGTTTKTISFTVPKPAKPAIEHPDIVTVVYESEHEITGQITSPATLTSVKAQILSGTTVKQTWTITPNARTLDLGSAGINEKLVFSSLAPGSYTLKISAVNAGGTTTISDKFTVPKPAKPVIEHPDIVTVVYESEHEITGQITSPATLTSVKAQILSGTTVKQTWTIKPNVRTLDLGSAGINEKLVFSSLAPGSYTLKISAVNAGGTTTISDKFTVPKPAKPAISMGEIGEITYGSSFVIPGDISSDASLTSVKVEIYSGSTLKQSCTKKPNVRTFDLRSIESSSKFDFSILKRGSYKLKITAVNAGGTSSVTVAFKIV